MKEDKFNEYVDTVYKCCGNEFTDKEMAESHVEREHSGDQALISRINDDGMFTVDTVVEQRSSDYYDVTYNSDDIPTKLGVGFIKCFYDEGYWISGVLKLDDSYDSDWRVWVRPLKDSEEPEDK